MWRGGHAASRGKDFGYMPKVISKAPRASQVAGGGITRAPRKQQVSAESFGGMSWLDWARQQEAAGLPLG